MQRFIARATDDPRPSRKAAPPMAGALTAARESLRILPHGKREGAPGGFLDTLDVHLRQAPCYENKLRISQIGTLTM
jgi:hypothetical protein